MASNDSNNWDDLAQKSKRDAEERARENERADLDRLNKVRESSPFPDLKVPPAKPLPVIAPAPRQSPFRGAPPARDDDDDD